MKIIKIVLQVLGIFLLVPAVTLATMRFELRNADGPSILFPGGALVSGEDVVERARRADAHHRHRRGDSIDRLLPPVAGLRGRRRREQRTQERSDQCALSSRRCSGPGAGAASVGVVRELPA